MKEVKTMRLEICVNKFGLDLVDRTTGEVFASGADNINNAFNLLDTAGVPYDVRVDTGKFNSQKFQDVLELLYGDH